MPTRMYSRAEFIRSLLPFLQAFTTFGVADERQKQHYGYHDNNHIKHVVPPHWIRQYESVRRLPARYTFSLRRLVSHGYESVQHLPRLPVR